MDTYSHMVGTPNPDLVVDGGERMCWSGRFPRGLNSKFLLEG